MDSTTASLKIFEDTKEVQKDRQNNEQKKRDKHITHKTKDRATRTPLKTGC